MKTILKLLLPLSFIFCLNFSFAQEFDVGENKADSILSLIPYQKDTMLVKSYLSLASFYGRKDPVKTKPYLDEAKKAAKNINDNNIKGLLARREAAYFNTISDYKKAEEYGRKAIEFLKAAKNNTELADTYNALGITLKNLGRTEQALEPYLNALALYKAKNMEQEVAYVYGNLAVLYAKMGNLKVSNEYYTKVEKSARALNNELLLAMSQINRGCNLVESKDYEEALELYFGAIPFLEDQNRKLVLNQVYLLIGSTYVETDSLQKAVENLNKSIVLSNETGKTTMLGQSQKKIGEVYFKQGNYRKALKKFQQSLEISKETSNNIEIADDYLNLSDTYEKLGDVKKAYENRKHYFAVHDSVFSEESKQKLNDLEVRFKTEKSEQEVALQKKEIALLEEKQRTANLQRIGLIAGLILSIFLFGLGYYAIRQKMKRNKIEKEKIGTELQLKNSELAFKKKELTTHALHLAKKNEVLEHIKQKAKELKTSENGSQGYQQLIHTINFDQQDDKNWENFTQYFEQVHKDFSRTVKENYPDVTKNELRLMALLKMSLSSKEIATILNISADGVKKARQRLRKKMSLTPEESLESTVHSL